ncbi:phage tail protein [Marinomonas shanghaiensis]|uniref:phage tail protein n=1 Tax=Marinomonas shanghaiensis TaxID=2202418 RepID=UPI003A8F14BE
MKKEMAALSFSALSTALLVTAFVAIPQKALACSTEPYIGSVCVMATDYCPRGYSVAAGQTNTISSNQVLFALLGYNFGGDNRTTFGYPDLRGRAPIGTGQAPGLTNFNLANKVGQEAHTLALSQMPIHTHAATFTPSSGANAGVASGNISLPVTGSAKIATSSSGAGSITPSDHAVLGKAAQGLGGVTLYSPAGTTTDLNIGPAGAVTGTASGPVSLPVNLAAGVNGTVNVATAGGSQAFSVVAPRIALTFCIATTGIYPSRP